MRLKDVKAVLFDLDGTLVDSCEAIVNAVQKTMESKGLAQMFDRVVVAGMIGVPLEDIFRTIAPSLSEKEIWELVQEYRKYYRAHHLENTSMHPSVKKLIRELKARHLKLGIITGKYREAVIDVLTHFGISDSFDVIVTSYEVNKHKPAPDIVIEAARRLNVNPTQCVVVGDSALDISAGKQAGAFTVALLSSKRDRRLLEKAGPTAIVEELRTILNVL